MEGKRDSTKKQIKLKENKKTNLPFLIGAMFLLVVITMLIYLKSLDNQFLLKWDDDIYVTENVQIKTMGTEDFLKNTFTTYVHGNYHPLTMLSLSLDYKKYKLDSKGYHKTNLILHVLNSILVLFFIWLLTKQKWVSLITALLFAIHPMHVESVAWISERKDLLYSFFFLAGLCTYIVFIVRKNQKSPWYLLTILLFLCSTLSKGMSVSFPIVLFVIDFFKERKFTFKILAEKIPFLIIAVIMGLVAIQAQKESNALNLNYTLIERLLFACYATLVYVWKLIAPLNLSSFYRYPALNNIFVIISPIIISAILCLIVYSFRFGKNILFGSCFFISTILLVLQIIPVGEAVIAERYSYLPYIGLFYIIAHYFNWIIENPSSKIEKIKFPVITVLTLYILMCCFIANRQTKAWHDDISLWTSAIKSDESSAICYKNRGDSYDRLNKKEEAIVDFSSAIKLNPNYSEAYNNRGIAYAQTGMLDKALEDFNASVKANPKNKNAYNNIGNAFFTLNKYEAAIKAYSSTIELDSKFSSAYNNRSIAYTNIQQFNLAYKDALKAKELGYPVDVKYIQSLESKQ
jgi:tetratricopeptide (TPR) repeat protein